MLEHVAANPSSPFAHAYRAYVREVLVPRLNLIADIITQHGAYIEYPPMDYFKERFSGEASWGFCKCSSSLSVFSRGSSSWRLCCCADGPTIFMSKWLAYTSDWRPVLAEWERGEYVLPRISLPTFSTHELKSAGALN